MIKKTLFGALLMPPEGMIRPVQGLRLATIAYLMKCDCLEVGSWVGRSTSYIACGLRFARTGSRLTSIDKHFDSRREFEIFFGEESLDLKPEAQRFRYLKHLERPGGTLASLKENLCNRGLLEYVEILKGDILSFDSEKKFRFIFADVIHDRRELERNIPKIINLLAEDAVLVCDDFRHPNMVPYFKEIFPSERIYFDKYMLFTSTGPKSSSVLRKACLGCAHVEGGK